MIESDHLHELLAALRQPTAYPYAFDGEVELIETHISWVLLAGELAYKIKKPIRSPFLDYSTLELRKECCERELRLNRRFASELYLDVVAIAEQDGKLMFEGDGEPLEFAVKMKRFPADGLLRDRLNAGLVQLDEIKQLAARIADFHLAAEKVEATSRFGSLEVLLAEAMDNFAYLASVIHSRSANLFSVLEQWTCRHFETHRMAFQKRYDAGHIRECHGDLHLGNVMWWQGDWIPFDGIEFSEEFRWIDTLSDAAFMAMDLAANGRLDYCHSFLNAYFEATGDYDASAVLEWYLVYRALVRAKVAGMRAAQLTPGSAERDAANDDLEKLLTLAYRFTIQHRGPPQLWITYGVSGSGKTSGSEQWVQRHGAIRIRADVERKRMFSTGSLAADPSQLYSQESTVATYQRLAELAEMLLRAGGSVVVDATCLKRWQREMFYQLSLRVGVRYGILAFHADHATLRQRITDRRAEGKDASDADHAVLQAQFASIEHLEADELQFVSSLLE